MIRITKADASILFMLFVEYLYYLYSLYAKNNIFFLSCFFKCLTKRTDNEEKLLLCISFRFYIIYRFCNILLSLVCNCIDSHGFNKKCIAQKPSSYMCAFL